MTNSSQETDPRQALCDSTRYSIPAAMSDVTTGVGGQTGSFPLYGGSDPVSQARSIVSKIEDPCVAEQVKRLLFVIDRLIEAARHLRADLRHIPPLHAYQSEDGSVLVEWIFPDFRIGFNIESNQEDSGWHLVSNKRLGEVTASGQLTSEREIMVLFAKFVLPNI